LSGFGDSLNICSARAGGILRSAVPAMNRIGMFNCRIADSTSPSSGLKPTRNAVSATIKLAIGNEGKRKNNVRWCPMVSRNERNEESEMMAEQPGHCLAARIALDAPIETPQRTCGRPAALSRTQADAAQTSRLSKIPIVV